MPTEMTRFLIGDSGVRRACGHAILLAIAGFACVSSETKNANADDNDGDGRSEFIGDCDDSDSTSTYVSVDEDCDGVLTSEDCDDRSPSSGAVSADQDCDGVLTADDCDDYDASAVATAADFDCDGVLKDDDCDDADPSSTTLATDADCDGALAELDCDDLDPSRGDVDDSDCDGVPTHAGGGDMIRIAAGSFDMGCTPGQVNCESHEAPVMPVTLTKDFYMSETEITQSQYQAVVGENPSAFTSCGDDCPVENVNWNEAASFANALSALSGLEECYTCITSGRSVTCTPSMVPYQCVGYRIATEAEWEYAARCGQDTLYAGSDDADLVAWYLNNSDWSTHAVARRQPNACGLYDMSGNVAEWVQDYFSDSYYTSDSRTDPTGPETGSTRVIRGGAWYCDDTECVRVAHRWGNEPEYEANRGIRLVRTIR